MMNRHSISVVAGGILILLLAAGADVPGLRAADLKPLVPAAPAVGSGGPATTKPVPPPVAGSAGTAVTKPVPPPVAGSTGTAVTKPVSAVPVAVPVALPGTVSAGAATAARVARAAGKSDPFKPFMETNLAVKKKLEEAELKRQMAKRNAFLSPLQKSDIGQFRLVGIVGDEDRRTAMVEDGVAKRHYPLVVGTYIGLNGGRVAAILPDRVIVEEQIEKPTKTKKAKVKRVTVMLHKDEEEEGKP
jgi:Tfp pilus assembly protein PilP